MAKTKYNKLYVKFDRPKTVREFIKLFFKGIYSKDTFWDVECKKRQCTSHRLRSIDDMMILIKTYYPTVTKAKIFEYLISTSIGIIGVFKKEGYLNLNYCSTIQRPVFNYSTKNNRSNYSIKTQGKNSNYRWYDLILLIGEDKFNKLYK